MYIGTDQTALYAQRYETIRQLVRKVGKDEIVFDALESIAIVVFGGNREEPPTPEEFDTLIDKLRILVNP